MPPTATKARRAARASASVTPAVPPAYASVDGSGGGGGAMPGSLLGSGRSRSAFVQPTSGEAVWYLSTGLSKRFFAVLPAAFARRTGAGRRRHIVLVLDNAGWHGPAGLAVPDGAWSRVKRRGTAHASASTSLGTFRSAPPRS
jgi:hypothetical protein